MKANGLRVLDDGVMLKSQANLLASQAAPWSKDTRALEAEIVSRLGGTGAVAVIASNRQSIDRLFSSPSFLAKAM